MPPLETPKNTQASLAQSLMGSLILSPESWCTQGFVCALQEYLFPQSYGSSLIKSCWPSKPDSLGIISPFVRFPGWEVSCGTYKFCNSVRTLVFQFVSCLPGSSMVELMVTSFKRTYALHLLGLLLPEPLSPRQATADSFLHRRPASTQRQVWFSFFCGGHRSFPSVPVHTRTVAQIMNSLLQNLNLNWRK